jgi:membrane associated rhomboid family serine protease
MLRDSIAKFFKVDSLISNLTGYVETRIELLKVEAKEEFSKGLSNVLVFVLLAFVFAVFIVLFSVAVAMELSEHLGGFAGFAIVSAFYLVLGFVLMVSREALTKKLEKKIATAFNKKRK